MGAQWKQKGREAAANARGKIFSKLAKELIVAAKNGADPAANSRLRIAIEAAKKASMPKDTLERAIKRGAGLTDGSVQYDTVTFEGHGPHRLPVIVECLTDNKNRTSANLKMYFRKYQLGSTGAVSWDFVRLGAIEADPPEGGADPEEAAIEAGAQDLEPGDEGQTRFFTEPTSLDAVGRALTDRKWSVTSSKMIWKPKNPITLEGQELADAEAFLEQLDADDDVQALFVALA